MTRDSWVLSLTIVAAIFGYLANMPPPDQWNWNQWMATVLALLGIVAGKLSTSPLPGEKKDEPK